MTKISTSDLCTSNTDDPDQLCALFDNTLPSLLDRHAPVKCRRITARPRVPWMTDEILVAKRHWRKAEKNWRVFKQHANLLGFRSSRNYASFLMNKARCDYYIKFVNENSVTQRRLFNASKYITIC